MLFIQKLKRLINPLYYNNIDFIGDIHGYYNNLISLLIKLDYQHINNSWYHSKRKALFLGDFINRGNNSLKTLVLIKKMVETGNAFAILGNHELYFLEYYYSIKHNRETKLSQAHINQIEKVFSEFTSFKEVDIYAAWLASLPLFIELKNVRAVHAYWSDKNLKQIIKHQNNKRFTNKKLKNIFKQKSKFSKAVWQTVKGIEFRIPKSVLKENPNIKQSKFRIKWWLDSKNMSLKEISFDSRVELPNLKIRKKSIKNYKIYKNHEPILFFGHYCLRNRNHILRDNLCCLDGCIAGDGKHILAYRWFGEKELKAENILSSQ